MTLDALLERWGLIEADFLRYYGIGDPLALPSRKFRTLLGALPSESRTVQDIAELFKGTDRVPYWKRALDRSLGRGVVNYRTGTVSDLGIPGV